MSSIPISQAFQLLLLYDGAIHFALIARRKIEEEDHAGKGVYIGKVQAIVSELTSSLDFSVAPELCQELEQLYLHITEQLTAASLEMKTEPIDLSVELLKTLREGWSQGSD